MLFAKDLKAAIKRNVSLLVPEIYSAFAESVYVAGHDSDLDTVSTGNLFPLLFVERDTHLSDMPQ